MSDELSAERVLDWWETSDLRRALRGLERPDRIDPPVVLVDPPVCMNGTPDDPDPNDPYDLGYSICEYCCEEHVENFEAYPCGWDGSYIADPDDPDWEIPTPPPGDR